MSFFSIEFYAVFFLFFILYWSVNRYHTVQNLLLLCFGYFILGFENLYILEVLIGYSLVIYICSLLMNVIPERKEFVVFGMFFLIGGLIYFKYYDFFRVQIQYLLESAHLNLTIPELNVMMPLGISFYTFHAITYLVSVRKGEITTPSILSFFLYLSFFPSVTAGPINRAKIFLPQITNHSPRVLISSQKAFMLIAFATIKVVWLAPMLATYLVDPVFSLPSQGHTLDTLMAIYAYAFLIYLNFSGYTELVTGLGMLLGFQLPPNFDSPYQSKNLREFWQRWHISLSTFIRDYIYIPLGGNRKGVFYTQLNLMIAIILSGIWHGVGWNFLIWGLIHGLGMVIYNLSHRSSIVQHISKVPALSRFITFNYVCFAWIFFRSETLETAQSMLRSLLNTQEVISDPLFIHKLMMMLFMLIIFFGYPFFTQMSSKIKDYAQRIHWLLFPIILASILTITLICAPSGIPEFIYSRF